MMPLALKMCILALFLQLVCKCCSLFSPLLWKHRIQLVTWHTLRLLRKGHQALVTLGVHGGARPCPQCVPTVCAQRWPGPGSRGPLGDRECPGPITEVLGFVLGCVVHLPFALSWHREVTKWPLWL